MHVSDTTSHSIFTERFCKKNLIGAGSGPLLQTVVLKVTSSSQSTKVDALGSIWSVSIQMSVSWHKSAINKSVATKLELFEDILEWFKVSLM